MTKRVVSLKKLRKLGLAAADPFGDGEFWQAIGKAGPENSYTGVLARREDGKRWGEIVVLWDGKETRIGTFERVKVWGEPPKWFGHLELTGEWSRLPLEVRRGSADIEDSSEDSVRDYLVETAVKYFTNHGGPRARYTTTGKIRWDDAIEVVPTLGESAGCNIPRYVSHLSAIDVFKRSARGVPDLSACAEVLHSAMGNRVIINAGASVKRSYIGNYAFVGGEVSDSYIGDRSMLSEGSCVRGAHIGRGVWVGQDTELIGGDDLTVDIRCPEARVPSGVHVYGRASEGKQAVRYLVLGPIGDFPLTAIEDDGSPCAIEYAGEEFFLDDLIQALYRGYGEEPSRLDEALHRVGSTARDQLRALLPLLVTTFPEMIEPSDYELALYGERAGAGEAYE